VRAALDRRLGGLRICAGRKCRLAPHLRVKLLGRSGPGRCLRRPLRARLKGADLRKAVLAEFFVNGRRVARDRRRPFLRKLPYKRVKRKKVSRARLRVTLLDGRRMTIDRNLRTCR
ncbi:MAG: hypothetical protein ACRDKV_06115, partial [Solirubrobacterales bacterium]